MTKEQLAELRAREPTKEGWVELSRDECAELITDAGFGHNADWYRKHPREVQQCRPDWVRDFVAKAERRLSYRMS